MVLLLGVAFFVVVRLLPGAGRGDVDPAGLTVGLVSLSAALWSGWMAVQAARWQETDLAGNADRLAGEVMDAEQAAWRQLLGARDRPINVSFVHHPALGHEAAGAAPHGTLKDVADYYVRLSPRRLVITGAPGAGKTVLALQLMLLLLERRSPGEAVPVRLSLSSFDTEHPLEEWIARHLVTTYGVSGKAARALVKGRRVLPVLDGLDEMEPDPEPGYDSRAARALRALNAYQQGVAKAQLVLTCRSGPYMALQEVREWAHDAARIELSPLDATTAWDFLTDRVDETDRWQTVLNTLADEPDGPLATGLSTPWRLALAATVYEQRDLGSGEYLRPPNDLLAAVLNTPDAVGEHLLGLLIPAATALSAPAHGHARYSPDHVRTWLTVLARYLDDNATPGRTLAGRVLPSTDIVLGELWPLVGYRRVRAAVTAITGPVVLAVIAVEFLWPPGFFLNALILIVAGGVGVRAWVGPDRIVIRLPPFLPHRLVIGSAVVAVFGFIPMLVVFGLFAFLIGLLEGNGLGDGLETGLRMGLAIGSMFGLLGGLSAGGEAGFWHVALLLCTRKRSGQWLPWRLRRFLEWCSEAGLVRKAGLAYQFRHRELQDYLAHHEPGHPAPDATRNARR
ncbi:NACHT domain-containing protein [Streptomyces niveus]|uniref:NACHT domain-containing protein n=1 Tax=Streptomyces niveus TaxID=193462 RepID=UPI0036D3B39E